MAPQTGTTLHLPEAALYRLGLSAQPFADAVEPPFEDSARITQLNVTLSLLQSGERIVLISGGAGLGKSTFLQQLAARQPPGLSMQRVDGARADAASLWGALIDAAENEEGPRQAPGSREQALNYVRSARRGGLRPALLVDDAHALPPGDLGTLLELWAELGQEDEAFSLALAMDPEALEGLAKILPTERVHTTTLYPLTQEQTGAYLHHRTRVAGAEHGLFDHDEIREIFHRSGGHPERINQEGHRRLTARLARPAESAPQRKTQPTPRLPGRPRRWLIGGLAAGGTAAAASAAYWLLAHPLSTGPATDDLAIEEFEEPEEETVAAETDDIEPAGETPFGLELPGRYSFRDDPEDADPGPAPVEATETLQLLETPSPSDHEAPEAEDGEDTDDADTPVEGATDSAEAMFDDGAEWVRGEEAERYTIQILAASQPTTLQGYAEQHPLDEPTHLVATERDDGDPWFLLLHGSHADRDAAHAALESLPDEIAERGAWVRSFESVAERLLNDD